MREGGRPVTVLKKKRWRGRERERKKEVDRERKKERKKERERERKTEGEGVGGREGGQERENRRMLENGGKGLITSSFYEIVSVTKVFRFENLVINTHTRDIRWLTRRAVR